MSVELPDETYERLKKDADDNRAVKTIMRWLTLIVIFAVFMLSYGCHAIDMVKQREEAQNSVTVREIESQGLTYEQYIDWLEAKGDQQ